MLTVDSSLEFMSEKEYSFSYQMTQEAVISRKSTIWGSHCMYLQLISYLLKGILIFFSNSERTSAQQIMEKKLPLTRIS